MEHLREGARGPRWIALATLLNVIVVLTTLAGAAGAQAATYHAFLCRVPYGLDAGKPAPADGLAFTHAGTFVSSFQDCAGGGAMRATMDGSTTHPYGDSSIVTFKAPATLTIAGFRLWRHEAIGPTQPFGAPATNIAYTGVESVQGLCAQISGCSVRGNPSVPLAPENEVVVGGLSGVTDVRWDASCGGGPGGTCLASGDRTLSAVINVFAADMLLNDGAPPTVTGLAGPLVAGGTLSGAQSLTFNAADAGSGVRKGTLVVDGVPVVDQVLDANGGACADLGVAPDERPSFLNTQPCAAAVSGLLTLDTNVLTPGGHALTVVVSDAAGNPAIARTGSITVVGSVPPGTANGTGASRSANITATFTSNHRRTRHLAFSSRPAVNGWLVDEARAPIAGAAVEILARERRTGAQPVPIATAQTGPDGGFQIELPSGPARTITVQYRAFSGDPAPAIAVRLSALVNARLTASISPRPARVGRPTRITGRVTYLRRGRVDVQIQALQGRIWRTIDTVRTRADGRFRFTYRFAARQAGHTFSLRARVASAIYPFAAGHSRVLAIHVRR